VREARHDLGCNVGLYGRPWFGGRGGGGGKKGREVAWLDGGQDGKVWQRVVVGYNFSRQQWSATWHREGERDCELSSIAACAALRNWSASMAS
jgi:hypothetical protein